LGEEIKSDETIAGKVSEQMSRAATNLVSGQAPTTLAEKTTVSGNEAAKSSISTLISASTRLSNALTQDGNNLHTVAKEFAEIDQKMAQELNHLNPYLGQF
jgi:type VII secretion effector (TIGR04197 family)